MGWVDDAQKRLREAGYRVGSAGSAVLEHLAAETCCWGAQEIHEELTARGRRIGLASVYRMLERLDAEGLVQRIEIGDGIVRYEPARHTEHHHHLVCADCGKVEPFADPRLERAIHAVEERSGYSVVGHEVLLRGSCAECASAGA